MLFLVRKEKRGASTFDVGNAYATVIKEVTYLNYKEKEAMVMKQGQLIKRHKLG